MKDKTFIDYANSFQAVARLRLEGISELMQKLGDPQDGLKYIHVAGTNGKGSVCSFLQNILTDAGYKTGKFISPNMIRVNERISVDGQDITDDDLFRIISEVEKKAKEMEVMPTQFEIWTAAAFCYFAEKKCDYVILEVGMGGERDATNIIKAPLISAITKIAYDHTEYLGDTLSEIAAAKAGIIKPGGITVSCIQDNEAMKVIEAKAKEMKNMLFVPKEPFIYPYNGICEVIDYADIKNIQINMLGLHQVKNAALAIECALCLGIDEKYIKSGIKKARNPGRLEILKKEPAILFDGAHNANGAEALFGAINRYFKDEDKCYIIGAMRDKDITGAAGIMKKAGISDSEVFCVKVKDNPRAADAEELSEKLSLAGISSVPCRDICDALEKSKKHELTVVFGSLYLYKDIYEDFLKFIDKNV